MLVERVRKLLDKAARTDNSHEADAFAAKAAELVAQHRIDPERLASSASDPAVLAVREVLVGRGAYARARLALLTAIGDAHDVRVVFQSRSEGTVAYCAGHLTDLDVVEVMYTSLHQQAAAHMARLKRPTGSATQQFRRSFLFGFAERIGELLAESRRQVERAAQVRASRGDLVVVELRKRSERVDDYVAGQWGRVRSAKPAAAVGVVGWQRGTEAAEQADVSRARLRTRGALGRGD